MKAELFGPLGSQKYVEYVDDINWSGGHLLDIINDILDVSAIEAGKLELHEEDVNIADARRLKQIFLNLLSNAVKFTPEHGEVSCDAYVDADGAIVVSITDTGIGMDDKGLAKAMEQFGQVDSSLARKHDGTGLGLSLTKGLVELHGGVFSIQSALDKGTKVMVKLPAERVHSSGPLIASAE